MEDLVKDSVSTGFWRGRRVFLTGHTGFKGGWMALWLAHLGANVRGYAAKSSLGANCSGLTKMLATTVPPEARAMRSSDAWPGCRLPMVGTSVTLDLPASARRISATV